MSKVRTIKATDIENLKEKVVYINRVAKVVKGGRRFSFNAIVVVGNGSGIVGIGLGKSNEVSSAIAKATTSARKRLITVPLRDTTIPYSVEGSHGASNADG